LFTFAAAAQPCQPSWQPDFPSNNLQYAVRAWATFDDGTGPAVYAGGDLRLEGAFQSVNLVKWTAAGWVKVGTEGVSGTVSALVVHDDGSGPALFVAGMFTSASGVSASNIVKWNGTTWTPLGPGTGGPVLALAVHNDGTGPALYAAGEFTNCGPTSTNRIAKWNGSAWLALGSGLGDRVRAITTHNNGTGEALYAGGDFLNAGGSPADHLARWNGSSWVPVGGGLMLGSGPAVTIRALKSFNDGSGSALYVGGNFAIPQPFGEPSLLGFARLTAGGWSRVGSLDPSEVHAIAGLDLGSGPRLFIGGTWSSNSPAFSNIAQWNGTTWSNMSGGAGNPGKFVFSLAPAQIAGSPRLLVGGNFTSTGPYGATGACTWSGTAWAPFGNGPDAPVDKLLVRNESSGVALYAGGRFRSIGSVVATHIARFDGSQWTPLGAGVDGSTTGDPSVFAMASFDDGTGGGPALYAAGRFNTAGGAPASNIAKWNGSTWSPLGLGLNGTNPIVVTLAVHDDGTGPALYAGGTFSTAGTTSANNIARWNGTAWSRVSTQGMDGFVSYLLPFDDGSSNQLYACGSFLQAGGQASFRIARWNGAVWAPVGDGFNSNVVALGTFDSGGGPELYAGGQFSASGTAPLSCVAKWNGSTWLPLQAGIGGP
jgi:hypothetical protein